MRGSGPIAIHVRIALSSPFIVLVLALQPQKIRLILFPKLLYKAFRGYLLYGKGEVCFVIECLGQPAFWRHVYVVLIELAQLLWAPLGYLHLEARLLPKT